MAIQWSLVIFTFLTGAAGWMFTCITFDALAGKNESKALPSTLVALILMIAGGIAAVFHLAHPENILAALNHPGSSIFTEAVLVGLAAICMAIFAILSKGTNESALHVFGIIGSLLGIILSFSAGNSYVIGAIAPWNNGWLPLGYLFTVMPVGAALYILLLGKDESGYAYTTPSFIIVLGGILGAIVTVFYGLTAGAFESAGLPLIVSLVGSVAAAACGIMMRKKPENTLGLAAAALLCACVGAIGFRAAMWVAYKLTAIGAPFFMDLSSL